MGDRIPREPNSGRRSWRERETSQPTWGWRERETTQDAEAAWRFRLARYALALAALLVFFVAIILKAPKTMPFRAVAWTDYSDPVPPNSYAQEDIERFEETFQGGNVDCLAVVDRRDDVRSLQDSLRSFLKDVRPGGPKRGWRWSKKGAVVIYISAHGAVDEQGRPCLLADAHDPLESATWIPVSEVLSIITSSDPERLRDAVKLVILDATRIRENWRMGVLHNSFAERLGPVVQEARLADPNLYVLNSTRFSQQGLVAPEMAGSFFAHSVAAGLHGAADQAPRDKKISLQELYEYVQREVDQFAHRYRAKLQRPVLIPEEVPTEAVLAYASNYESLDAPPLDIRELNDRHSALVGLWEQRDQLEPTELEPTGRSRAPAFVVDPVGWAKLNQKLVRLEQVLLAGKAYDFDAELADAKTLLDQISRPPTIPRIENCSIALARHLQQLPADTVAEAEASLKQWLETPPDAKEETALPTPQISGAGAAAATWNWLGSLGPRLDRDALQKGLQFLDRSDAQSTAGDVPRAPLDLPEVRLLRLLDRHLDWSSAAAAVARAVQAEQVALATAAAEEARSHHWVRDTLDEANEELRLARDDLFVGNTRALESAAERWKRLIGDDGASGRYGDALDTKQKISQAYRLRDEICSVLPDFALWVTNTQPTPATDSVLALIRQVHQLGQALDGVHAQAARANAKQNVESLLESTTQSFDPLKREIERRAGKLRDEDAISSRDLHDVELLLRTSLVTGNARAKLRQRFLSKLEEQAQALGRIGDFSGDEGQVPQDTSALSDPEIALSADTRTHPALELLGRTAVPEDSLDSLDLSSSTEEEQRAAKLLRLAEIGGKVRHRLSNLSGTVEQLSKKTDALLTQPEKGSSSAARLDLSRADQLARCAAGLLSKPLAVDPCRRLIRLDTGYLILSHAERTILDFWGREDGRLVTDARHPEKVPYYFSAAAEPYLAVVRQLTPRPRAYENNLGAMVARLVAAADRWGLPKVRDIYLDPEDTYIDHKAELPRDLDFPSGAAAFSIQGQDGKELPQLADAQREAEQTLRRSFDPSKAAESPLPFKLQSDDILRAGSPLAVCCYYRGHLRRIEFSARSSVGVNMVFQRPQYGKPTVHVKADSRERSQVIFVLDCSYSMRETTEFEQRVTDRLDVARKQLVSLLENLNRTGSDSRIGLILYGHRAGWLNNSVRRRPGAPGDLHPGADVERVISPPKPFMYRNVAGEKRNAIDDVRDATNDLEPWGETPLYFAISTALQSFDTGLDGPRHVVVITDGVDQQSPDAPEYARTTSQDVEPVLNRNRAQIDIILFSDKQISDKQSLDAVEDLRKLAEDARSQGKFHRAQNPGSLLKSLEEALLKFKFSVHEADDHRVKTANEPLHLGDTWTVEDFDKGADYTVQIDSKATSAVATSKIRLEGGEAIDLTLDRKNNRLIHGRYTKDERDPVQENVHGEFYVAPHVPDIAGRDVTFRVSVQNQNAEAFSPRPRHVWAEIRPLPKREPVYYIQDALFEENVPVPVLRLECRDFPSDRAEVSLWFTFQQDVFFDASRLDKSTPGRIRVGDASLEAKKSSSSTIVIIESHEPKSQQYPLRVQLQPPADAVVRSYLDEAKRVRHVFSYTTQADKPQLLVGPQHDSDWIGIEPIQFQW